MFDATETRDKTRLRGLLAEDPVAAAYLLGDLVEPFFSQCRWLVASYRDRIEGIVLLYTGLSVPALLTYRAPDAIGRDRSRAQPLRAGATEHVLREVAARTRDVIHTYYATGHVERWWVMGIRAADLISPRHSEDAVQLTKGSLLEPITELYEDYPGNYFEASQLESGAYYGVYAGGKLISIAGTHVLAPAEGIAVLGNVVTARAARRSGHASACTARLAHGLGG